jgi:hypothetical protein
VEIRKESSGAVRTVLIYVSLVVVPALLGVPLAELCMSGASTVVLGQGTMAIPFLMGSLLAVALTSLGEGASASSGVVFNAHRHSPGRVVRTRNVVWVAPGAG